MRQYSCRNTVVFLERQYSIPVGILFFYLQLSRCFVLPKQSIFKHNRFVFLLYCDYIFVF